MSELCGTDTVTLSRTCAACAGTGHLKAEGRSFCVLCSAVYDAPHAAGAGERLPCGHGRHSLVPSVRCPACGGSPLMRFHVTLAALADWLRDAHG